MYYMKYTDGTILENHDLVILYPRRILKKENYEIWQYPYFDNEVLYDDFDLQLIVFKEDIVRSFHVSEKYERLKDRHLFR